MVFTRPIILRLHRQTDGQGETALAAVKGQEGFRAALKRDGDMEQINRALAVLRRMFFTQFVGPAQCIRPANRHVNKQPCPQTLIYPTESLTPVTLREGTACCRISKGIADLNAVKRGENQRFSCARREGSRRFAVRILTEK